MRRPARTLIGLGLAGLPNLLHAQTSEQRIGVMVDKVKEAPLRMSVRTVGIVQTDETKVAHVHLKTEGWVDKVFIDYTGQ